MNTNTNVGLCCLLTLFPSFLFLWCNLTTYVCSFCQTIPNFNILVSAYFYSFSFLRFFLCSLRTYILVFECVDTDLNCAIVSANYLITCNSTKISHLKRISFPSTHRPCSIASRICKFAMNVVTLLNILNALLRLHLTDHNFLNVFST